IRSIGPLDLFGIVGATADTQVGARFATINSQTPDLRVLSTLPPNTALASTESQTGISNVNQSPPLEQWQVAGDSVVWQPATPAGRTYRIADLDSKTIVNLDHAGTSSIPGVGHVNYSPEVGTGGLTVSIPATSVISNGDFADG